MGDRFVAFHLNVNACELRLRPVAMGAGREEWDIFAETVFNAGGIPQGLRCAMAY